MDTLIDRKRQNCSTDICTVILGGYGICSKKIAMRRYGERYKEKRAVPKLKWSCTLSILLLSYLPKLSR